jgi:hypothetical protein
MIFLPIYHIKAASIQKSYRQMDEWIERNNGSEPVHMAGAQKLVCQKCFSMVQCTIKIVSYTSIICMILRYDTIHCDQPNPLSLLLDPRTPTGLHASPLFPPLSPSMARTKSKHKLKAGVVLPSL